MLTETTYFMNYYYIPKNNLEERHWFTILQIFLEIYRISLPGFHRDSKFSFLLLHFTCYDITCHVTSRKFHRSLMREWELKRAADILVLYYENTLSLRTPWKGHGETQGSPGHTLRITDVGEFTLEARKSILRCHDHPERSIPWESKGESLSFSYNLPLREHYARVTYRSCYKQVLRPRKRKGFQPRFLPFSFLRIKRKM